MKSTTILTLTDRRGIPDGTPVEFLCDKHLRERHPGIQGRYLRDRYGRVVGTVVPDHGDHECETCDLLTKSPILTSVPF